MEAGGSVVFEGLTGSLSGIVGGVGLTGYVWIGVCGTSGVFSVGGVICGGLSFLPPNNLDNPKSNNNKAKIAAAQMLIVLISKFPKDDEATGVGISVGLAEGRGVYLDRVTTTGVPDAFGFDVDIGFAVGVGVALQPQVESDAQSGFRQNPAEQKRPLLQL